MAKFFKNVMGFIRANIRAIQYGFFFGRGKTFRLPKTLKLHGRNISLGMPDEPGIKVALADIFLHDCYGLSGLKNKDIRTVLDVGGNVGLFGLAARCHFPLAQIHSYEPNKRLMFHLIANAAGGNFFCFNEAVGFDDGKVSMNDSADSVLGTVQDSVDGDVTKKSFKSAISRLGGSIDLVKMDCEGGEWEILNDHESWKRVRFVTAEYHLIQQYKHEDIVKQLRALGFEITRQDKADTCGIVWAQRKTHK